MRVSCPVGIGLRRDHFEALEGTTRHIDFVEVQPESFVGRGGRATRALAVARERGPVLLHSVSLSLGGPDPVPRVRARAFAALARMLDAPHASDHVCVSALDGIEAFDLLPLPFTDEAAAHVARRAREVRSLLERPLLLENVTIYEHAPIERGEQALDEGAFLRAILEEADAHLLLDVSNLVVNARNHGTDARAALDALPLDRVAEIHLAGHRFDERLGLVIDDHASGVSDASLGLYAYALERIGRPVPTLLEWDQSLPTLDVLLDEADRIRARAASVLTQVRASGGTTAGEVWL